MGWFARAADWLKGAAGRSRLESPPASAETSAAAAPPPAVDDDNRSVRVFVSSTFLDMQTERDELVRKTFPALRDKYRARGVELFEVDLRWGITREQQERGETLPTLLAEIDRCRPYFIGLLGDRYGWVPPPAALSDKLRADFPAIVDAQGASVTAMEIMHGVLSDPAAAARACFFERDSSWDWIATLDEADRAATTTETDAEQAKLAELKALIRQTARVESYARPDEIGPKVADALEALLDAQFPDAKAPDAFEQDRRLHRAYARDRRGLHVGAESYIRDLDLWMETDDAAPRLITGASGGGKSALIANWAQAWGDAHPESRAFVFEHYLGASPDSADPVLILRRLWEHLNRASGETVDPPDANTELMDLSAALASRLAQAQLTAEQNGARLLIALDGLDKLSSEQNLRWLPIPPGVHLLASSLPGEAQAAALERGFAPLEVKPLSEQERRELITRTLAGWGRALTPQHIARILTPEAAELAGSPLYLKTVLEELRVSADHARLADRLEQYRAARDMPDLFDRVLGRLEEDCAPGLAAKALPLIWASRAGLEEAELLAIAGASPLAWAVLRNGLGDGLRDSQGRIAFGHDYLNQAVAARYLQTDEAKRQAHLRLADRFEARAPDARQAEELPYQLRSVAAWDRLEALLLDLDRFALLRARGDGELLSYWLPLKERGRDLEALLCGAFEARAGAAARWTQAEIDLAFALDKFLHFAGATSDAAQRLGEERTAACERLLGPEHPETLTSMNNLAATLRARGHLEGAQDLQERVLAASTRLLGPEHPQTLTSMNNLAETLRARGDLEGAQDFQERALAAMKRLLGSEHPDTLKSMGNLAATLRNRGDLEGAQDLQERVLTSMTRLLGPEHPHTLTSMVNLTATLKARGDLEGAQNLEERVLAARTRLLGAEHPDTLSSINNLAATLYSRGDLKGAQDLEERVLAARTRLLGPEHPDTLTSMNNLALTLKARGDLEGAQGYQERVLAARTRLLGPEHPSTLTSMGNLAETLRARGDLEGPQALQERVLAARTRLLGPEHPDTLVSMNNLALTLFRRGDLEGAQDLQERVLATRARLLGSEHPDTLTSMDNLAGTLHASGDLEGAQDLQERVLAMSTRLLGPEHPHTLTSMVNLAVTLHACGNLDGALRHAERALEGGTRRLGAEHPITKTAASWVAGIRGEIERCAQSQRGGEDAAPELPDALVDQVFGDPRADALLRQVMAQNNLTGEPADLPRDVQRAIVKFLVDNGVISFGSYPDAT